jgi:hypothetical protein
LVVGDYDINCNGLAISDDGIRLFFTGYGGDTVWSCTLSTPYDLATATVDVKKVYVGTQDATPQNPFFGDSGTKMYVMGAANDTVYQYTLSTAWDVSTATYASKSFSVTTQETTPFGLFFGPNTSTSNRAMIGGMVGNNSSGSYSIKYGTTRENVSSVKGVLSDGSIAVFEDLETEDFREKTRGTTLESAIYRQIAFELSHPLTQEHIKKEFPEKNVTRRNTGYAVDQLLDSDVFEQSDKPFNFSKLLCGSEGTLMLFSEITLKLVPLPTENIALICAHFDDLDKSLNGAVEAMKLHPNQCELMDKIILDCTKDNILQAQNRFFIKGDPAAILMIEVEQKENSSLSEEIEKMIHCFESKNLIYDHTVLYGNDIKKALHLRASGLGVLQNIQSKLLPK